MTMAAYNFERLPQGAKRDFERLQRRIRELEAEIAALRAEPGALDRNVFDIHTAVLDPYGAKVPVGDGHVEWMWPGSGREKRLSARFVPGRGRAARQGTRDHVYLNAAMGYLRIKPVSSNALELELYDD